MLRIDSYNKYTLRPSRYRVYHIYVRVDNKRTPPSSYTQVRTHKYTIYIIYNNNILIYRRLPMNWQPPHTVSWQAVAATVAGTARVKCRETVICTGCHLWRWRDGQGYRSSGSHRRPYPLARNS